MGNSNLKVLGNIHIRYDVEWEIVASLAKELGIKTFAELEMYCRVWNIKNKKELYSRLGRDYRYGMLTK